MIRIMSDPLSSLFTSARNVTLSEGDILFRTGDAITGMFRVLSGEMRLVRHTVHGASLILQRVRHGGILAEASAYSQIYHCDGEAVGDVTLQAIGRSEFLNALQRDANLSTAWSRVLARGVQSARTLSELRTLPRVADRLDAWLDLGNDLPDKGRWQEVARELGVTREAFYRELAKRR